MAATSSLVGFEPYKFKALPKVSFGYYGVTFNSGVIDGLNNPSYVQILLNHSKRQMAVKCCESYDLHALSVKMGTENRYWRINYRDFNKTITDLMGWDTKSQTYAVSGRYYADDDAYIFELDDAEVE